MKDQNRSRMEKMSTRHFNALHLRFRIITTYVSFAIRGGLRSREITIRDYQNPLLRLKL